MAHRGKRYKAASGAINREKTYPLTEARRAHEVLESRVTQGSSLLLP